MPNRTASKADERRAPLAIDDAGRRRARVALALALVLLSLWVAQDFLAPLAWAVVIALTIWPAYRRLTARMSGAHAKVLAPLLSTLAVGVVLFIPVALALHQAAQESEAIAQYLGQVRQNGIPVPPWLAHMPLGEHAARWWSANLSDPQGATALLGGEPDKDSGATLSRALGAQMAHRLFLFFVALTALFALLRDGAWIGNRVLDTADQLFGTPGERLASRTVETVQGTVNGTVVVAVAEGILIGAAYVIAGVPNPLLFALGTMAFATVPLGAWVVFSAAALLLVLQGGSVLAAAGLWGFGAVVMLIGDMFVWPALVGSRTRLPFLLALIGIFGGLQAFGLIGLFIGPMILAAFWAVWREWIGPAAAGAQRPADRP
jgi:predicted PurR-regulated permease PerM